MPPDGSRPSWNASTDASRDFVFISTKADGERALIEGSIAIPGLPVCHLRMRADADRLERYGAGRAALMEYVREALREDALSELPLN